MCGFQNVHFGMGTYSQEVNMTQLRSQTNFYYSKNADTVTMSL